MPPSAPVHAFRTVPRTGVIYVTTEAASRGYGQGVPGWCNLGQGQPETGDLPGAPARIESLAIAMRDQEYAPPVGLWELREAVAHLYNELYRKGRGSKYTAENVCVAGGGRTLLTRAAASLGPVNVGHFLPDYTAYEELLDIFKAFTAIPILLDPERGYRFSADDFSKEVNGRGLSAILLSNPSNPTGRLVCGDEMDAWVHASRKLDCALLVDEFYSHYIYGAKPASEGPELASAAMFVDDVNKDPVLLFDGFTKNWRYPGWRVTWAVGPRSVVDALASAGSFLDGGGSKPLQRAAVPLVEPARVRQEAGAIQAAFRAKRDFLLPRLAQLGIHIDRPPDGTFYVWGSVAKLAPHLGDGMAFFKAALERQVITVPGEFFDVNPGKRRRGAVSRFKHHVRFSFGPEMATLVEAATRLEAMIRG